MAHRLKHLSAMWETPVRSLGWEDPLAEEMATHSSILAWRIPWMEEPGALTVHGVTKSQKGLKTSLAHFEYFKSEHSDQFSTLTILIVSFLTFFF